MRIYALDDGCVAGDVRSCAANYSCLKRAICSLAGPVAEAIYSGARFPDLITEHIAEINFAMAEDALDRAGGSLSFDVALAATQRLVEHEWPRINRVAA